MQTVVVQQKVQVSMCTHQGLFGGISPGGIMGGGPGVPSRGGTGLYMYDLPGIGGGIPPGGTGGGIMGGGLGVPSGVGTGLYMYD